MAGEDREKLAVRGGFFFLNFRELNTNDLRF